MSYYVSIGDVELDGVLTVAQSGGRDISTYDSVGGGKFAVAQNKGLREWVIKCEINDHDTLDDLDKLQKRKAPVRLVIKADDYKVSERVFLKTYSREEEYAGVFPTTINVIEFAKVGVKTAAVPYMARPGTKVLAATVTIGDGSGNTKSPDDLAREAALQAAADGEANAKTDIGYRVIDPKTGKNVANLATLRDGDEVYYDYASAQAWENEEKRMIAAGNYEKEPLGKGIGKAWDAFWKWMNTPL